MKSPDGGFFILINMYIKGKKNELKEFLIRIRIYLNKIRIYKIKERLYFSKSRCLGMKKIHFRKLILLLTLVGGVYSSQVIYAETVNSNKIHTSEEAVNEAFIKQFPYAEQFIDKDGVPARRIKAPDIGDRFLKKGETREKIRRINLKYKNTDKTFSRIYQTLRYFGTYESEKGSPETLEKQEFTYEVDTPEVNKKEEILEGKITPEIHEKGELEEAKPPILEVPEYIVPLSKKGDPLVFNHPEYKEEQNKDIPPVVVIPKKGEPKESEKTKVPEEPKEETTKEKTKEAENTIPETTKTEEKKDPQLPRTGESIDGGVITVAFISLVTAMLLLVVSLKEKIK